MHGKMRWIVYRLSPFEPTVRSTDAIPRAGHPRKNPQPWCFPRQVQRALNLALADRYEDDGLNELFVDDVTPAPDCGHLLVHVVVPANRSVMDALSSLRGDASRLRSEVAMTISRKRAPELSFVPTTPGEGDRTPPARS